MKKIFLLIAILLTLTITNVQAQFVQDVIVTSSNGIWTDSRAYATLNDAVTAVGANKRTIVISSQQTVTTLTIPSTVTLRFERDGSIANSAQLTINTKNIEADNHQIFTGAGNIDFASGTIVKSSWFQNIETAFALTGNDTITLLMTAAHTVTASYSPGNNVLLKWNSPGNVLTVNAGVTVGNLKLIESGDFQIFGGAGDFDFLTGTILKSQWFNRLRSAISWIESEEVTIQLSSSEVLDMNVTIPVNVKIAFNSNQLTGAFTLSFAGSSNKQIIALPDQQLFGSTTIITFNGGTTYVGHFYSGTGDATAAINKALASGADNVIATSLYPVSTVLMQTDVNFIGQGWQTGVYSDGTTVADVIYANEVTDWTISNMKIDGKSYAIIGIHGVESNNISITQCELVDLDYGTIVSNSSNVEFSRNSVHDITYYGFDVYKDSNAAKYSKGIIADKNTFYNIYTTTTPGPAVDGQGIIIDGYNSSGTVLNIYDVKLTNNEGYLLGKTLITVKAVKGCTITGNTGRNITYNNDQASVILLTEAAEETIITANTALDSLIGIHVDLDDGVDSAYHQVIVSSNIIQGCTTGIKNQNGDDVIVSTNSIKGGTYGILFGNTFSDSKILYNILDGQSSTGIRVANTGTNITSLDVIGNTVISCAGNTASEGAYYFEGLTGAKILNNTARTSIGSDLIINTDCVDLELSDNKWTKVSIASGGSVKKFEDTNTLATFLSSDFGGDLSTHLVLGAGFTIKTFGRNVWRIGSAGVVTSDTTTAIADGYVGQRLLLINDNGANNIIIKDAANTLNLAGDNTIAASGAAEYVFESTGVWRQIY